jgi:1-acyl-sn-glycerol-3-phosphate acyltransferase
MAYDDSVGEIDDGEGRVFGGLRSVVSEARLLANRYIFASMVATAGVAAGLMGRLLPERHRLLPDHETLWSLGRLQARLLSALCGVSITVEGSGRVESGSPFLFVANHQSIFDVVLLLGFLPVSSRFVATPECVHDRVLGPVLRLFGVVVVDPEHPERSIERIGELTRAGISAIAFPEGRRNRRLRLLPFADLPFEAAIRLGIPVVPIAVRGTRAVMPEGGFFAIHPGRIEMIIEEPIPTADLLPEDQRPLSEDVHGTISRYVDEVAGPADIEAIAETAATQVNGSVAGNGAAAW